uniref:Uncharacterized protein n=1 Tax=Leersia perrieri TaxID=77586 RepID=A0A0D9XF52_9ORYZ
MGVAYRRLTPACESRRGGGGAAAARAWWAAVRRAAAAGLARMYCGAAGRRRWAAAARRRIAARARAARRYEYDSASYARNFDDGVWKAEEGVFWSAGAAATAAVVPCPVSC